MLRFLPLHECAHGWVAYKLGDDTAMYQGRLTLIPIAHLDPVGSVLLLLTGYGWAKPVPVNPNRFTRKHSLRFGMALTAAAGPASNLLAGFIGMIILRFYMISDYYTSYFTEYYAGESVNSAPMLIFTLLSAFVSINIGLAVFNLVPVPPLDGSKIVAYFTGDKVERWITRNYQVIRIVFFVIVVSGILSVPLSIIDGLVYSLFLFLTNWIPALFG
jgi:Zn-dependent protease